MSFFSVFFKSKNKVPNWANFFTKVEYDYFIATVHKTLDSSDWNYKIKDGFVKLQDKENSTLGLLNLAKNCKNEDLNTYAKLINEHFSQIKKSQQFDLEFKEIEANFEKAKKYLGVKICSQDDILGIDDKKKIAQKICADIYMMLIFDQPHSISSVPKYLLESWHKSPEELFKIGIQNIKNNYTFEAEKLIENNFISYAFEGNSLFESTLILDLENHPHILGNKGAFVTIPNQNIVLVYPINTDEEKASISNFAKIVLGNILQGNYPNSVSKQLFLYSNGKFKKANL